MKRTRLGRLWFAAVPIVPIGAVGAVTLAPKHLDAR